MTLDLTFKQDGREENIVEAPVRWQQVTVSLKSEELVASIQNTVQSLKSGSQKCGFTSARRQTSVSQRAISIWEYLCVKEGKHVKLDEASDNTEDTAESTEMHRVWRFTWPGAKHVSRQEETTDNDDASSVSAEEKNVV